METLQLLGVALGMATLSGLNLYLTVFVTGLAIQQHWIVLSPAYGQLEILGNPAIIGVAGLLYFLEFFADKIPWVDSLWDSLHTLIRPIGAAFIAIRVLGEPSPVFDVIIALLAGGAALLVHGVKAGTRLVANASPEPFSNVALSVSEDLIVLGGLSLIHWNPVMALAVFGLVLSVIIYFLPKLFRAARVILWLAWKKLGTPAIKSESVELPCELNANADQLFSRLNLLKEKVLWAVPCLSGALPGVARNVFGYLVATEISPQQLHFVAERGKARQTLELAGYRVAHEPKFLSENVVLYSVEKGPKHVLVFDRSTRPMVKAVVESLRKRLEPLSQGAVQEQALDSGN